MARALTVLFDRNELATIDLVHHFKLVLLLSHVPPFVLAVAFGYPSLHADALLLKALAIYVVASSFQLTKLVDFSIRRNIQCFVRSRERKSSTTGAGRGWEDRRRAGPTACHPDDCECESRRN